MKMSVLGIAFFLLVTLPMLLNSSTEQEDLLHGSMRGPLLHEHSFQAPLVHDWWEEGVPHFMLGGSAVATDNFLRLTANNIGDHGFTFNTAPMDHDQWEVRVEFSIRPPAPILRSNKSDIQYEGGEGLALWYLDQPIGDDHQHVLKYSKPISTEVKMEMNDQENGWRVADTILNFNDDEYDEYEGIDEDDLTEDEKQRRASTSELRDLRRRKKLEFLRKIFNRGTSTDDTYHEPRIMGVKYSDFSSGFAVIMDSVGDEDEHMKEHKEKGDAIRHHHHKSTISLLLNLPNHTMESGAKVRNNFWPTQPNFRQFSPVLQCTYDFRHVPISRGRFSDGASEEDRARDAPEKPVELILRYFKKKLSILIRREDVHQREVLRTTTTGGREKSGKVEVQHTFTETLCGEVYPLTIPLGYYFGLSASTAHYKNRKEGLQDEDIFHQNRTNTIMHVDIHDVFGFELRELGTDARAMGYSRSVPVEHFDYENDKLEREHFSRQVPLNDNWETAG